MTTSHDSFFKGRDKEKRKENESETMANFFFLLPLALCLSLQLHLMPGAYAGVAAPAPSNAAGLLAKACERSYHKGYCIKLLSSERNSNNTNLKGLAFIALRIAERNATFTAKFLDDAMTIPDLYPEELDALVGCSEHYKAAIELLEDAINALVSNEHSDVTAMVKAALSDLGKCAAGLKGKDMKLTVNKNRGVSRIFNTALSVAHVFAQ